MLLKHLLPRAAIACRSLLGRRLLGCSSLSWQGGHRLHKQQLWRDGCGLLGQRQLGCNSYSGWYSGWLGQLLRCRSWACRLLHQRLLGCDCQGRCCCLLRQSLLRCRCGHLLRRRPLRRNRTWPCRQQCCLL